MRFTRCSCDEDLYVRIPRALWMRMLWPSRRLYYCHLCNRKMLIRPLMKQRDSLPPREAARRE